ncbi:MAG: hypothetical protein ACJAZY_003452 [Spirosomataceae bacterium]|jgi:hypothetical protein
MKLTTSSFIFLLFISTITFGQEKSTLIIIRDTGTVNWLTNYSAFDNDDFIGKIPNKSVTKIEVEPGMHTFNFQFYGRKRPNPKRMKATMQMEAGKAYYVTATTRYNGFFFIVQTLEITENSAVKLTPKLKPNITRL